MIAPFYVLREVASRLGIVQCLIIMTEPSEVSSQIDRVTPVDWLGSCEWIVAPVLL